MNTSPIRFSGLTSGMDTQSMVQQLMRAESMRMYRLTQRRQLLQWRQEVIRNSMTHMNEFRTKNTDYIKEKSITNSATWNTFRTSVTGADGSVPSGVSVVSNNDARTGSFNFQVQQKAQGDLVRGERNFDLTYNQLGSRTMGEVFTFTGAQTVEINGTNIIANSSDTVSAFMARVNASGANVNMSYNSVRGTFEMEHKRTGENATISTGGGSILQRMGLGNIRTGLEPPPQDISNGIISGQPVLTESRFLNANIWSVSGATAGSSFSIGSTTAGVDDLEINITSSATVQSFINQINTQLQNSSHSDFRNVRVEFKNGSFYFAGNAEDVNKITTGDNNLLKFMGLQNITGEGVYNKETDSGGLASARNNTNAILNSQIRAFTGANFSGSVQIKGIDELVSLTVPSNTTFAQFMDMVNDANKVNVSGSTGVGMFYNPVTGAFALNTTEAAANRQAISTNNHALLRFFGLNEISWSNLPIPPDSAKEFNEFGFLSGSHNLTEARFLNANLWSAMGVEHSADNSKITFNFENLPNPPSANPNLSISVDLSANTSIRGFMTAVNTAFENNNIDAKISFSTATGSFVFEGVHADFITTGNDDVADSVLKFFGLADIDRTGNNFATDRNKITELNFMNTNIWTHAGLPIPPVGVPNDSLSINIDGTVINVNNLNREMTIGDFVNRVNSALGTTANFSFNGKTGSFEFRDVTTGELLTGSNISVAGNNQLLRSFGFNDASGNNLIADGESISIEKPFATNSMMDSKISAFGAHFVGDITFETVEIDLNGEETITTTKITIDKNTTFQQFMDMVTASALDIGMWHNANNGLFSLGITSRDAEGKVDIDPKTIRTNNESFMQFLGLSNINNHDPNEPEPPKRFIDDRVVNVAQNAKILYDPGTDAFGNETGHPIEQETNTFDLHGHRITLGASLHIPAGGANITINAERDTSIAMDAIKNFIEEYNELIRYVNSLHTTARPRAGGRVNGAYYEPLTDEQRNAMSEREIEQWEEQAKTGLLHRDSDMRRLHTMLRDAMYQKVNLGDGRTISLHEIGITTVGRSGAANDQMIGILQIEDEDRLRKALEERPNDVEALFSRSPVAAGENVGGTIQQRN
ncbi:MAG: flagellar filament capping protein FliD, partial [Defluviitaleaceae bacterium]|nr:flagellar filament capping protein FliD [Defluviitaleaceae bacterium]